MLNQADCKFSLIKTLISFQGHMSALSQIEELAYNLFGNRKFAK